MARRSVWVLTRGACFAHEITVRLAPYIGPALLQTYAFAGEVMYNFFPQMID